MALHMNSVTVDALDPAAQARFWVEALGWHLVHSADDGSAAVIAPARNREEGGRAFPVMFWRVGEPKPSGKNRWHFDVAPDDQATEVARLEALGARRVDIGQDRDGPVDWVVMADPEGNEFCVLQSLPGDPAG
jgi:catechol 2,3-dioxygenase-like lactoylglutathione lyase family enzyme